MTPKSSARWSQKKAAAFFILDGPESLLKPGDATGQFGWLNQLASLRVLQTPLTNAFSWVLFKIAGEVAGHSDLPKLVLRRCIWQANVDKQADDAELRITVCFYEFREDDMPDWTNSLATAFEAVSDPTQPGPPQIARTYRRHTVAIGTRSLTASYSSVDPPEDIGQDWARVTSFADGSTAIEPLEESYYVPLVGERFRARTDGSYGWFTQFFLDTELREDNEN